MRSQYDPDTDNLIAFNQLVIEAAREVMAKADRERERLRLAIEESQKLRDRMGCVSGGRIERPSKRV